MRTRAPLRVDIGDWQSQRDAAVALRHQVFVEEQGVPVELELDEMDAVCEHAVAWCGADAVGTARLLPDGHIGRMAVDVRWRGQGVGAALLQTLIDCAREQGHHAVRLHAQLHARGFYARFGFLEEGAIFEDAGIAHIAMRLDLSPDRSPDGTLHRGQPD